MLSGSLTPVTGSRLDALEDRFHERPPASDRKDIHCRVPIGANDRQWIFEHNEKTPFEGALFSATCCSLPEDKSLMAAFRRDHWISDPFGPMASNGFSPSNLSIHQREISEEGSRDLSSFFSSGLLFPYMWEMITNCIYLFWVVTNRPTEAFEGLNFCVSIRFSPPARAWITRQINLLLDIQPEFQPPYDAGRRKPAPII